MKEFIKNNNLIGRLYLKLMLILYKVLNVVVPVDDKLIVFTSFSARQYSDSPRALYESFKKDLNFKDFKLVWFFNDPTQFPEVKNSIKMGSIKYYYYLFKAKYWISNTSIERLIPINSKKHIYINTWHGIPLKQLDPDEPNLSFLVKNWYKNVVFDILTCSSEYDYGIFHHIFPSVKKIITTDIPRNELLARKNKQANKIKKELINELNLDLKKPILLYAPTFREFEEPGQEHMLPFVDDRVLDKYNVLFRGHYFTPYNNFKNIKNVSDYNDLDKLLIACDLLVTDYSSIVLDYSLLGKSALLYMYDWKKYKKYRGFYVDPSTLNLPIAVNREELSEKLLEFPKGFENNTLDLKNKYHTGSNSIEYLTSFILNT
ncbi:CDP-glycerol glycerophosphotransferase family protein [Pediococcus pentosaceus]|uniref:CDP-glycerol glycerophosphotransferase family protein n=1 Tax=Pediococcus pentosaceus TaxID=1255 RepID=UPI003F847C54